MRRDLGIAVRARLTWAIAAASALLVGHGFILAVDVYSASSRSALASTLEGREMDPLAGIVRPMLGGLDLAISIFAPLVAARVLSIEKERRTFGALCLLQGGSDRVVVSKLAAALTATALMLVAPAALLAAFRAIGGHVDPIETGIALSGSALHLVLVTAVSIAAAAWTQTVAQAAALAVAVSLTSWAIDAANGFAALAWLGGASAWSIDRKLDAFERGIVEPGAIAWLVLASAGAAAIAVLGARFDLSPPKKTGLAAGMAIVVAAALVAVASSRRGYDWSEQRRASLPPAVVDRLRDLRQPLSIDVLLDRDDSRRAQLEADFLAKLYLARPDLVVHTPLDARAAVVEGWRDADYGQITVHVGESSRRTRSTSRRELTTLVFEAAGIPPPDWTAPIYPGFPVVVDGRGRTVLASLAYVVVPCGLLAVGLLLTRRRAIR